MNNELTFQDIMNELAKDLLDIILLNMRRKHRSGNPENPKQYAGMDANSDLYESVEVDVNEFGELQVYALNYFVNVDQGRRKGAKAPPHLAILKWLKDKGIRARAANGQFKSMTLNQLAFLIGRSIKKWGIPQRNIIKDSIDMLEKNYKDNVEGPVQNVIDQIFDNLAVQFNRTEKFSSKAFAVYTNKKLKFKKFKVAA